MPFELQSFADVPEEVPAAVSPRSVDRVWRVLAQQRVSQRRVALLELQAIPPPRLAVLPSITCSLSCVGLLLS